MKLSDIITPVNTKYGAPMGRNNIGRQPITVVSGRNNRIVKKNQVKVYEKRVPLIEGYDMGGAYWGIGPELRVRFTKDLSYVEFFRM
jgi:hypothetical protein